MFLNHLANAGDLVDRRVVDDEYRIWKRPLVHPWKQVLNKAAEIFASDTILEDFQVYDTIKADGREN